MVAQDDVDKVDALNSTADAEAMKKLRFRSYRPRDESLQKCPSRASIRPIPSLPACPVGFSCILTPSALLFPLCDISDCDEFEDVSMVVADTQAEYDAVLSAAADKFRSAQLDVDNIVPKKANWELKRALKPKLDRLEKRTERALLELAREAAQRGKNEGEGGDLFARTVAAAELVDSDQED